MPSSTQQSTVAISKVVNWIKDGRQRSIVEIICVVLVSFFYNQLSADILFQLVTGFIICRPTKTIVAPEPQVVGSEHLASVCSYIESAFSTGMYLLGSSLVVNATSPYHTETKKFGEGCIVHFTRHISDWKLHAIEFRGCENN